MPAREVHKLVNRLLLGSDGNKVHEWMDKPQQWMGRSHRKVRHDTSTVALIAITQGIEQAKHAIAHIATDKFFSKVESTVKKQIKNGVIKAIKSYKNL